VYRLLQELLQRSLVVRDVIGVITCTGNGCGRSEYGPRRVGLLERGHRIRAGRPAPIGARIRQRVLPRALQTRNLLLRITRLRTAWSGRGPLLELTSGEHRRSGRFGIGVRAGGCRRRLSRVAWFRGLNAGGLRRLAMVKLLR